MKPAMATNFFECFLKHKATPKIVVVRQPLKRHHRPKDLGYVSVALADDLMSVPVRERSATGDRYEYQALWGLALIFSNHKLNDDYAILFEFHDDIALLNHSSNPTTVRFYQIKSKDTSGGWTLASLLKRPEIKTKSTTKSSPSHLDKMYDSISKFSDFVLSVDFVSNQFCSLKNGKKKFRFSECDDDKFKEIVAAIQEAYPTATESQIGLLGFEYTDLSLGDAASHMRGKLQEFVASHLGHVFFSPEATYQIVTDECRRKSNFKGETSNFDQAIINKGITKRNVQKWLDDIRRNIQSPEWKEVAPDITYSFSEKRSIRHEYIIYRAAALDASDHAINQVRMKIVTEIYDVVKDRELKLCDMVEIIYEKCHDIGVKYLVPFRPEKLKAMIIYEIHIYQADTEIQTAYQESEEEKL